jgi:hypothetical protein
VNSVAAVVTGVVVGGVVNIGSVFGSVGNCVVTVEVHSNEGTELDDVISVAEEMEVMLTIGEFDDVMVMLTIDEVDDDDDDDDDDVVMLLIDKVDDDDDEVMLLIDVVDDDDDVVRLLIDEIDNMVDVGLQRSIWALST